MNFIHYIKYEYLDLYNILHLFKDGNGLEISNYNFSSNVGLIKLEVKNNDILYSRMRKIIILGEIITISEYVINQIPYIDNQIKGTKNDHVFEINYVPPKFIKLLNIYFKNDYSIKYMKKKFDKLFETQQIENYLKILGMKNIIGSFQT